MALPFLGRMSLSKMSFFVWMTALGKNETHYSGGLVVMELKATMLKSLYVWMTAYNCSHFSIFLEFFDMCSSVS